MMRSELADFLPRDKLDTARADAVIALGFPSIEPILPELLEWMQDINWPVAQVLQPFLAKIGSPLVPHVRRVLGTDDDVWKRWVQLCIIAESPELRTTFKPDLERLASRPTTGEKAEELDQIAGEILGNAE